ncbi:MAG: FliA/WhiG family RNA polymerase sigma factor [Chloroflexota bacterium]
MDDQHLNVTELWVSYTEDKDRVAREKLILHYTSLVKYVVSRLALRLPRSLEPDDLISFGVVGLIDAIDRFDLSHQVKFETYALRRIRGQIIDALRNLDIVPRSTYTNTRKIQEVMAKLSQSLGRVPTDLEIATSLDFSLSEYHRCLVDANCVMISLDQPFSSGEGEELTLYEALEDQNTLTPAEQVDRAEMRIQLKLAIEGLSRREQLLISLYYHDELTMKEVGQLLGVSESRVSQMHAKIMLRLQTAIERNIEPDHETEICQKSTKRRVHNRNLLPSVPPQFNQPTVVTATL